MKKALAALVVLSVLGATPGQPAGGRKEAGRPKDGPADVRIDGKVETFTLVDRREGDGKKAVTGKGAAFRVRLDTDVQVEVREPGEANVKDLRARLLKLLRTGGTAHGRLTQAGGKLILTGELRARDPAGEDRTFPLGATWAEGKILADKVEDDGKIIILPLENGADPLLVVAGLPENAPRPKGRVKVVGKLRPVEKGLIVLEARALEEVRDPNAPEPTKDKKKKR